MVRPTSSETQTLPQDLPLESAPDAALRLIPMGGVGQFGMNMMCYELNGERIVVDCGAMIPEPDMPGVDLVIPDVSFLLEDPDSLKAFVLTHGHDDHIAALPFIMRHFNVPIYGTALTLALLEAKLSEHALVYEPDLRELTFREPVQISDTFQVEAISVTHSIPDAAALIFRTSVGTVLHTGDYKVDFAPVLGEAFDFHSLTHLAEEGLLAFVGDSTNSHCSGSTQNERWVRENLDTIFANSKQKIIASTFSSSLHRIQLFIDLAVKYDRKIFIAGRSMLRNITIASDLGFLRVPSDQICSNGQMRNLAAENCLVLATGTQGEPMAALSRLAVGAHKHVQIEEGDTVILSSRVIPGNARKIERLINHFCRHGANVFDSQTASVHVSGHAYAEEIKMMLSLTRPRFVVPVHGALRQLVKQKELAISLGYDPDDVFVIGNGDVLQFENNQAQVVGHAPTGHVLVDGKTIGETGEVVLRDRQHLSEDGMIIAILNVDRQTGELINEPEIVTRGFVYVDESEDLILSLVQIARDAFMDCDRESREESDIIHSEVRRALRRHIKKTYRRFPLILPVVQEIG